MKNEQIARITHEADRIIRASMGQVLSGWDRHEAGLKTEWRAKVGSLKGSDRITPQMRHDLWIQDMITAGWTQGTSVDSEKKTHPSICSYEDLPEQVHLLDDVFVILVETCIEIGKE